MKKITKIYLLVIVFVYLIQIVSLIFLLRHSDLKDDYRGIIMIVSLIGFMVLGVTISFILSMDKYGLFKEKDELQKLIDQNRETQKVYDRASKIVGNHFVMKYLSNNSGTRMRRNMQIYKRGK